MMDLIPDDKCVRLVRNELLAVRLLLAALSCMASAEEDLRDRLSQIPDGHERIHALVEQFRELSDDIAATINRNQCRHIYNTTKDFEMRLVPKLTPMTTNIILSKDQGKALIDCARWKCHECAEDATNCRKCQLYQLLEATTPIDDYDGLICPYALREWAN